MAQRHERMALAYRDVLAQTERLPPRKLRAYQESLLSPLLHHARTNVPFYRERLAPLFSGAEIDFSRWDDVPILTRAEAQQNTQALTAKTLPPHAGAVESGETSGSTGRPVQYLRNELAHIATLGTTDRALRWWQFDGNKTMATFVGRGRADTRPPDGTTERGWRIGSLGLHHKIDNSADTGVRIEWLRARRPHYLTAYSFALRELAEEVRARAVDLHFERIVSIGTALSNEIRSACEEILGTRPVDQYGALEVGLIACECPWCGHYHCNAETMHVELLNESNRPCSPGETGRVVVTSFYNYAMPFIRYEIGDLAVAGPERTKCRVTLPSFTRILGRYRNTFTLRDGRVIYPFVPVAALRSFIPFQQIQIVQTDYQQIEVRYVPLEATRDGVSAGLERYLQEVIDPSLSVRAIAVEQIPRSASGKYEDYVSLVPRGRAAAAGG